MDATRSRLLQGGWATLIRDQRAELAIFTATIFLSALMLFAVQPMFAKMVLPKLGGAPSVWAVSMCFFQGVLLAGYCYAHALNRFLDARRALLVHLGLMSVACVALPIALPGWAAEPPPGDAYLWLVGVLAAGVGLPFFAVSANAPLLQSWFARSGHPHAADPYFLYAASNVGSLAALLLYPVILEPMAGLAVQAGLWTAGFVALGGMIALSGFCMLANGSAADLAAPSTTRTADAAAPSNARRALWVALAFVPSALLVAFTSFLTTDIASAPFLWVIPLAMFLATFIMVFRERPVISHEALVDRLPLVAALAMFGTASVGAFVWMIGFLASLAAFFMTSLVCHRELYLKRPAPAHLTEFYLWMSLGGVLGGVFAAIIAPQVFTSILELPLALALGLALRPAVLASRSDTSQWRWAALAATVGFIVIVAVDAAVEAGIVEAHLKMKIVAVAVLMAAMLALKSRPALEMAAVVLMVSAVALLPEGKGEGHAVRSFFGVHRVIETPDGKYKLLMHGTTVHGAERQIDDQGKRIAEPIPATYYFAGGPMERGLGLARTAVAAEQRPARVGIVGLGAGSLACHALPGEIWRHYEIDKAVVDLARDPKLFRYLPVCQPNADIVLGDARLTVAKEPRGRYDYLLIDAFSSDAIPMHLLTVEALTLFLDRVSPGGVLALHLSNKHLDLPPVVAAAAARMSGVHAVVVRDTPADPGFDRAPSVVVYLSRSAATVAPSLGWTGATRLEPTGIAAWTDDYSDILGTLVRGWLR